MNLHDIEQAPPHCGYWDARHQLRDHVYARSLAAFARGDAARDEIKTRAQLVRRQKAVRRFIRDCLGGLPPSNTPLNARTVGTVAGKGFLIEKVIFESRPKTFVTANLYLPNSAQGNPRTRAGGHRERRGAVLFLCGHHELAKHCDEYQRVCQTLVSAGLVVFAVDPIGQGERVSYPTETGVRWGTMEHDYAGVQCQPLGDSIARYFLHDAMRALDYMRARPEIDPGRIGVTGNSGGGTQSCLMMLADPRIAAAAPGTFVMSRETYMWTGGAQDSEQIWPGFTTAGFDHEDVLLAMCPKPVRVLAVKYDFFPIEGTRRTVERCQRLWRLCGHPSDVDLVEDQFVHNYTPKLIDAATEFFARHLLGKRSVRVLANAATPFEPSTLWCTRTGQVRSSIPGARIVRDENVLRLKELSRSRRSSRSQAVAWLRRRIFAHRARCPLNLRIPWTDKAGGLTVQQAFWMSQQGICNDGIVFRDPGHQGKKLPVTIAVWDGGCKTLKPHFAWIRSQCAAGRAVLVVETTGVGHLLPHPLTSRTPQEFYGVLHKMQDDLTWLDDDLAALRAFDVTRAIDLLGEFPGLTHRGVRLYAHGRQGLYAQLAAAIDRRVKRIEVVGGIGSYAQLVKSRTYDPFEVKSLIIRDILRYADLPELGRGLRNRARSR